MTNTRDSSAFISWARERAESTSTAASVRAFISAELAAGPTALHVLLGKAVAPLPNGLKPTFISLVQFALKMHYLFGYKQCTLCGSTRGTGTPARQCTLASCETLRSLLPASEHAKVQADPDCRVRTTYPHVEGHVNPTGPQPGRQDSKRSRYDPSKPSQPRNDKMPRAHIR